VLAGVVMAKIFMTAEVITPSLVLLTILAGVGIGLVCGLFTGFIVAKSKCVPLIITLGTSQIFYAASLLITNGRFMNFKSVLDPIKFKLFGYIPIMLFILAAVVIATSILINRTKYGRRVIAIGGNEHNAFLSGINVDANKIIAYTISGLFCAIAALIFASRLDSITADAGGGYELEAMTAAIIGGVTFEGGRGTVFGAFLGALLMGIIANAMNILAINPYMQTGVSGAIIVIAVVLSNVENIRRAKA